MNAPDYSERLAVLESRVNTMESELMKTETRLLEVLSDIRDDLKSALIAINDRHESLSEKNAALAGKLNTYVAYITGGAAVILFLLEHFK
jgi:hypothetical protein